MANVSLAADSEIPEIEALCQRAFYQMNYHLPPRSFQYSSEHIKQVIARGIRSDSHICTRYERDGKILGFMAVGLTDFNFYSVGLQTAYEIVWHGDPALPPVQQLRVQVALLKDMLTRTEGCIFSLTLDEEHLELLPLVKRLGFTGSTRALVRR